MKATNRPLHVRSLDGTSYRFLIPSASTASCGIMPSCCRKSVPQGSHRFLPQGSGSVALNEAHDSVPMFPQECTFKPALLPPRRRTSSVCGTLRPTTYTTPAQPQPEGSSAEAALLATAASANTVSAGAAASDEAALRSASTRASAIHRSVDHAKYTSLEAQVSPQPLAFQPRSSTSVRSRC